MRKRKNITLDEEIYETLYKKKGHKKWGEFILEIIDLLEEKEEKKEKDQSQNTRIENKIDVLSSVMNAYLNAVDSEQIDGCDFINEEHIYVSTAKNSIEKSLKNQRGL